MHFGKRLVLVSFIAFVWATQAPAAVVENFRLGGWIGNAYTDDQNGRFDNCVASASYRSGITLHVQVDAGYNWAIGFSASHWDMKVGTDIPLQYRIDRGQWQSGVAKATTKNLARMQMPQDGYLITRFRRGRTLYVYDGSNQFNFRLTGTSKLMARLARCIKRNTARFGASPNVGTTAAPPPSGGLGSTAPAQPAAPAPQPADPQLAVEATQALFNLMGSAGVSGLKLIPEGQRSEDLKGVHAVAAGNARTLVAHIFPEGSYKSDQELMSLIVADSQKNCDDGSFSSGTERATEGGKQLYTSYARCTMGDDDLIERVAIVNRKAGGVFVYGVSDNYSVGGTASDNGPPELTDPDFYAAAAGAAD
ncbi:hypothetical protein [Roseibium sp.]|uniref:hypothetical protein n=1 Tax=Roseibium sp. TaxID=1936156 RepID=UPI003D11674D